MRNDDEPDTAQKADRFDYPYYQEYRWVFFLLKNVTVVSKACFDSRKLVRVQIHLNHCSCSDASDALTSHTESDFKKIASRGILQVVNTF